MDKIEWKIAKKIPYSVLVFLFSIGTILGGFYLYKTQRHRLVILLAGISFVLILIFLNPAQIAIGLIWITQIFPMDTAIPLGSVKARPCELYGLIIIPVWLILYVLPERKRMEIKFGWMEFFLSMYILVLIISMIQGIVAGNYKGLNGSMFRIDVFRGPFYFFLFFFFIKVINLKDELEETFVKQWFYATIATCLVLASMIIIRAITRASFSLWGFNVQLFSFGWGFSFALGLIVNKRWFLLSLFYSVVLFYFASRTVFGVIILIYFFIILFWLFTIPRKKRFITGLKIALATVGTIFLIIVIIDVAASITQRVGVIALLSRMEVIFKPRYIRYVPSLQARFLECLEAIHLWKQSNFWVGTALGERFATTMVGALAAIDVLYFTILAKTGILGLFSFLAMFAAFFARTLKVFKNIELIESKFMRAFVLNCAAVIPTSLIMGITMSHLWFGNACLLYTSPSPRDLSTSRMPSSA